RTSIQSVRSYLRTPLWRVGRKQGISSTWKAHSAQRIASSSSWIRVMNERGSSLLSCAGSALLIVAGAESAGCHRSWLSYWRGPVVEYDVPLADDVEGGFVTLEGCLLE